MSSASGPVAGLVPKDPATCVSTCPLQRRDRTPACSRTTPAGACPALLAARQGSGGALAEVLRIHAVRTRSHLTGRVPREDVEDLVQEVTVKCLAAIPTLRHFGCLSFSAYVATLERGAIADFYRRRRARAGHLYGTRLRDRSAGADLDRAEDRAEIGLLLSSLTGAERFLIWLRYIRGLNVRQTAEVVQKSEGAVRMATRRALATLRDSGELPRGDGTLKCYKARPGMHCLAKGRVPDHVWAAVAPLLVSKEDAAGVGRPRIPDRDALAGVLFVLRSGIPWDALPTEVAGCSGQTCRCRLREWQRRGVWPEIWRKVIRYQH
jgi:RNA polymerase sigma factor (sigma-70 family)